MFSVESQRKSNHMTILSLGLFALGIGCLLWAGVNIWVQSGFSGRFDAGAPLEIQTPTSWSAIRTPPLSELPIFSQPVWPFSTAELDEGAEDKALSNAETGVTGSNTQPLYQSVPSKGDKFGTLLIPSLKLKLPIIEGTRERDLERGVGHFIDSVLPGEGDNCVLSGHRDTIFRNLGKLKENDALVVTTSAGKFTYRITNTRIVDKDDRTVIVPTKSAVLTLTTCYPFYFVGHAPDRYVISASLEN